MVRVNVCPLGNGALAGSTLPLDRKFVAKQLGFVDASGRPQITQNSMDGVSDRDFMVEFCAASALIAVHLSRLAEDVILWFSSEFNFIKIADAYTTGSSLMPQKKNPDVAELTRGKSARVIGNLMSLLTLLKGLPMTYNRDLQEDKERLFDTADTVRACVRLMSAMLQHTSVNSFSCLAAASDPALLAHIAGFEWKRLFWERRGELPGRIAFLGFGHGCWEQSLAPYFDLEPGVIGEYRWYSSALWEEVTPCGSAIGCVKYVDGTPVARTAMVPHEHEIAHMASTHCIPILMEGLAEFLRGGSEAPSGMVGGVPLQHTLDAS